MRKISTRNDWETMVSFEIATEKTVDKVSASGCFGVAVLGFATHLPFSLKICESASLNFLISVSPETAQMRKGHSPLSENSTEQVAGP